MNKTLACNDYSFAVDFLRDLGEVAAVQIFDLECMTQVLST